MTERDRCDLCSSSAESWNNFFEKGGYTFVKCVKCGFVFTKEIPDSRELEEAYSEKYFNGEIYNNYEVRLFERRKGYISYLNWFQSLTGIRTGKILEVGCATGDFLDAGSFLGYETYGIELSEWASSVAKKKGHLVYNVNIGDINNSGLPKNAFDCIFLLDVFEHLPFPKKVIQILKPYLKESGIMSIQTLNIGSPTVRFLGKKWSHFYPPYHLSFFTIKTLKDLLEGQQFKIISVRTQGKLLYDDYINKYYLFQNLFKSNFIQKITNKLKFGYAQTIIAKNEKKG